jgi:ABC-type sugar transport system permease subunit
MPFMRNTFLFAFVIDAIGSFRLFTEPNVLVSRAGMAPDEVAPMLNLLLSNLRNARFGQASAVGWLLFVLAVAITFVQFRVFRATSEEAE